VEGAACSVLPPAEMRKNCHQKRKKKVVEGMKKRVLGWGSPASLAVLQGGGGKEGG